MPKFWLTLLHTLILSNVVPGEGGGAADRGDEVKVDDVKDVADLVDESEKDDKKDDVVDEKDEKDDKKDDDKKKDQRVPLRRMQEAVDKERAKIAERDARIKALENEAARNKVSEDITALRGKVDELDDKYEELLADGKMTEAKVVRKELRRLQDVLANSVSSMNAGRASAAAVEKVNYDLALASLENDYPALNPDHAEFDEAETADVGALMQGYMANGQDRATALKKAVAKIMGPKKSAADEEKNRGLRDQKAEEARKRGADAAKKQPADASKHGLDSDKGGDNTSDGKISVLKMNQNQFAKIDEDTKRKLRGDDI